MRERFIAYKKDGKFDKTQDFVHESCFVNKSDEEAVALFFKEGYESVIIDREQLSSIQSYQTTDEKKQNLKNQLISIRKKYLSDTDWYATRKIKRGVEIPQEIINKNILAADEISQIENCTSLNALNQFSPTFE